MNTLTKILTLTFGLLVSINSYARPSYGDCENCHEYSKVSGISGSIISIGSDTLANLMTFWAEGFRKHYPNVTIEIQAAGSSTAPPALSEATANLGPMSRKMKDKEVQMFEKKFGYPPTPIPVAIDALAVFVHKDNPIEGLTLQEVDAVFSSTRKCGYPYQVDSWKLLNGQDSNLQIFGRNSVSGTYGFFKKKALCKGDFKNNVNEQPGSASVVQSVSTSLNGIGYSGIGYKTSSVKTVPLSKDGKVFIDATTENAVTGKYPLSRFLYIYVNKEPNKIFSPLEHEFFKYVLSNEGQHIVDKDGYVSLPAEKRLQVLNFMKNDF